MRIEELCEKLKPTLGSRIDALYLMYQMDPSNQQEISGLLHCLAMQHLGECYESSQILLNPPTREMSAGEYSLGKVSYNSHELYPFGLREDELLQHVALFGRTGSGKTNCGFLLINNLLEKQKPFWIFDWKRNYRNLLSFPAAENVKLFTVGRDISPFLFNPLIPPEGTKPGYATCSREYQGTGNKPQ